MLILMSKEHLNTNSFINLGNKTIYKNKRIDIN